MKKEFHLTLFILLNCFGGVYSQSLPSYVPSNGLLAWYPFNGNANDESGNGHNGSISYNTGTPNGVTFTTDRFNLTNKAYSFQGSFINLANPTVANFGVGSYSVCAWFKTNSYNGASTNMPIISYNAYNTLNSNWILKVHVNGTLIGCESAPQICGVLAPSNYTDNLWHHVLFSRDVAAHTYNIYVDGLLISSASFLTTYNIIGASNTELDIGGTFVGGNLFFGSLDDIGIWNRALTQSEIIQLYTSPITLNVKVFIEGFYKGNNLMRATIDSINYPMLCDILSVELHNATPPYSLFNTTQGILNTDGLGSFIFPAAVLNHSYYIVLKHRNAVETWSKYPVWFNEFSLNYDFTK